MKTSSDTGTTIIVIMTSLMIAIFTFGLGLQYENEHNIIPDDNECALALEEYVDATESYLDTIYSTFPIEETVQQTELGERYISARMNLCLDCK